MKRLVTISSIFLLAGLALVLWLPRTRLPEASAPVSPEERVERPGATPAASAAKTVNAEALLEDVAGPGEADAWARLQALSSLGGNVPEAALARAYTFLQEDTGHAWEPVVKNELLNVLRRQVKRPEALSAVLIGMVGNPALSPTVRDYALQHLIAFYPRLADRGPALAAIRGALGAVESSLAGTALLGLRRLAGGEEALSADDVRAAARAIALNERASELSRMTALRLCGELDVRDVLPEVRAIVRREQNMLLRVAAIGALGELGDKKDAALLEEFIQGHYPRLGMAAQSALAALGKKNQS